MWAIVVALGVATFTMTIFAARLTRRVEVERAPEPPADPNDPWSAYTPRPLEDMDRPRPRIWPVVTAMIGLALIGGGIAGSRSSVTSDGAAAITDIEPLEEGVPVTTVPPTPQVTASPDASAAPGSTPSATTAPATATAAPRASGTGPPTIEGTASCTSGTAKLTFTVTAGAANLSWYTLHMDGSNARGGPMSGTSYSSSFEKAAAAGEHTFELVVDDKSGAQARKVFSVTC